jgi:hypothetical protein
MNESSPDTPALTANARQIKAAPWCWQHKPALRLIRDAFDREKTVSSALGTYSALTEIASDGEKEVFQTTHAHIALKSGLSARTVQNRLAGLSEIGLVKISTPALKSPSTYWLLPVPQPLPNDTQPTPRARQRTKIAALPASEEKKEEIHEENPNKEPSKVQKSGKQEAANTPRNFIPD